MKSPRTSLAGRVLLVAALLTSVVVVPAASASQEAAPPPAPARSGSPHPAYERVAHFYAAYIDVAHDPGDNALAGQLRKFYLTPRLREQLTAWEGTNGADGVLRAQNVPGAWKVTPRDSGLGHTWSVVRLTWGEGTERTYTYLEVRSDLETRKISGIKSLGSLNRG